MTLIVLQSDDFKIGSKVGYMLGYFSFMHPRSRWGLSHITISDKELAEAYFIQEKDVPSITTAASTGILAGIATGSFIVGALTMSAIGMINTETIAHLLLVFENGQSAFVAADSKTAEKILQKAKYTGTIDL